MLSHQLTNEASVKPMPAPTRRPKGTTRRWAASAVTVAGMLLAACCFWQGWTSPSAASIAGTGVVSTNAAANRAAPAARTLKTAPIESLRPGMRVLASNPELAGQEIAPREIDPLTDRLVTFRLEKQDGSSVEWDRIESLPELFAAAVLEKLATLSDADLEAIPASALYAENVSEIETPIPDITPAEAARRIEQFLIGRTVEVDLAELGVSGPSQILSIAPCPAIEPETGPGRRLITAVFRHQSSNVYDIRLDDGSPSIGVTGNHPFWSEDRESFVRADELHQGERLKKVNNTFCRVASLTRQLLTTPVTVYNLEVDGQHVYNVGANGVLVHNACLSFITYIGTDITTGLSYVGRARGYGTATQILAKRLSSHHRTLTNVTVDITTTSYNAIRGREQQLIDKLRGLGQLTGQINGISTRNRNATTYLQAALSLFGIP